MDIDLPTIRTRIGAHEPTPLTPAGVAPDEVKRAAVAAILRGERAPELLFIRRAEHPRDPWSGHMAFPGGRVDPADATPLAAAIRETAEEVGLALDPTPTADVPSGLLGRLSTVQARARSGRLPLVVDPFVFELAETPAPLRLEASEVQEALWVPLSFLLDLGNRTRMEVERGPTSYTLPCYEFEGRTIWGLTLYMLDEMIGLLTGARPSDW